MTNNHPPTELGQNILKLMELYMSEMKKHLILKAAVESGRTTLTLGETRDLEEQVRLILVQIFEEAVDELNEGKDPESVLQTFLRSRGK
jgi:hypothetical protein